jgi:hypothetical protein
VLPICKYFWKQQKLVEGRGMIRVGANRNFRIRGDGCIELSVVVQGLRTMCLCQLATVN